MSGGTGRPTKTASRDPRLAGRIHGALILLAGR